MCPAKVEEGYQRGYIIPIGGSKNKETNPSILKEFIKISGGDDAGEVYEDIFKSLGAKIVTTIPINSREDCDNPEFAKTCNQATGLFMTGGNQLRLATILGGTIVAKTLKRGNARGIHIAALLPVPLLCQNI